MEFNGVHDTYFSELSELLVDSILLYWQYTSAVEIKIFMKLIIFPES